MNRREREILRRLLKEIAPRKGEHPLLITVRDVLFHLLRGELGIAERLVRLSEEISEWRRMTER